MLALEGTAISYREILADFVGCETTNGGTKSDQVNIILSPEFYAQNDFTFASPDRERYDCLAANSMHERRYGCISHRAARILLISQSFRRIVGMEHKSNYAINIS